jgi:hypothetical protein
MTDRELLEAAAKAAGIGTLVWGDKYKLGDDEIDCTDIPYVRSGQPDEGDVFWDPLTDDGDALRLAVSLGISVSFDRLDQGIDERRVFAVYNRGVEFEHLGNDPLAATRRAIVRAAAEIGRSKK